MEREERKGGIEDGFSEKGLKESLQRASSLKARERRQAATSDQEGRRWSFVMPRPPDSLNPARAPVCSTHTHAALRFAMPLDVADNSR